VGWGQLVALGDPELRVPTSTGWGVLPSPASAPDAGATGQGDAGCGCKRDAGGGCQRAGGAGCGQWDAGASRQGDVGCGCK